MTAQIHENLRYEGRQASMAFCPPLPADHPRIVEIDPAAADLGPGDGILFSTACWRGYQGSWEIHAGRFYLTALRGRLKLIGDEPLPADWFTGVLRIPQGELLHYVHMGFGSIYEEEIHVKIEDGRVVSTRTIDNRGQSIDNWDLTMRNMPGGENRFPGDDQ